MMFRNSPTTYGLVSVLLHWSMAVLIFSLFGLGLWMVELDYYHGWYHRAPALHKSLGIVLAVLWLLRLGWRLYDRVPAQEPGYKAWEALLARWMHRLFYGLVLLVMLAGYLISTAEGRGIAVFDLFEVPALFAGVERQADIAGWAHWVLAWGLMFFALLHALAALRHHFWDRDRTLLKMLGRKD